MNAGKITISKPMGGSGNLEVVTIRLTDAINHSYIGEIEMSLDTFAHALFGQGELDCEFDLDTKRVGLVLEQKFEEVFVSNLAPAGDTPYLERMQKLARQAIAPFEKDGWVGDADDALNSHRNVSHVKSEGIVRQVRFRRYVKP